MNEAVEKLEQVKITKYVETALRYPLSPGELTSMLILHFDLSDESAKRKAESALIELARRPKYFPVEPVKLEELGEEELMDAGYPDMEKATRKEKLGLWTIGILEKISQATIAKNEKEQLYRRVK